jgi:hypothetical protein
MALVAEKIELQTNCDSTVLRLCNVNKFEDGSGYACTLTVRSGGFACDHRFTFDDDSLSTAIRSLKAMCGGSPGEFVIKYRYEQDFIRFAMNKLGQVFVTGECRFDSDLSQLLRFGFRTDQTVLAPLRDALAAIRCV